MISEHFVQNAIVDEAFAQVSALYEGVTLATIGEGTLAIRMDDLIASVASVLVVAVSDEEVSTFAMARANAENEKAAIINSVAQLAIDLIDGTIGEPVFVKDQLVSVVLADAHAIVGNFAQNAVVNTTFEELIALFEGVALNNMAEGVLALEIDAIISAAEAIVKASEIMDECLAGDIAQLLTDLFGGRVERAGYDGEQSVSVMLSDIEAILAHFVESAVVTTVIAELSELYGDTAINTIGEATLELAIDDIVDSVAQVLIAGLGEEEKIEAIATLIKDLLGITVSTFGYHGEQLITVVLADVKAIVDSFGVENAIVDEAFAQVSALYEGVMIDTFVAETLVLDFDKMANAIASVLAVAMPEEAELISAIAKLVTDVAGGTVSAIGYHGNNS